MKEYKIVYAEEGASFDENVSSALNDGWELYGNPWSHHDAKTDIVYLYQAIKRDITYLLVEAEEEGAEEADSTEESKDS